MTIAQDAHHSTYINVPEAVGVFDSFEALQQAIYDLRMSGFSRADISLLGSKEAMREKLGSAYWRAEDLQDNPDAPRAAFVSEEAIGELEGAISGGFFLFGILHRHGGHADTGVDTGRLDRSDCDRRWTGGGGWNASGAACRSAPQRLLCRSNPQWRHPALGENRR